MLFYGKNPIFSDICNGIGNARRNADRITALEETVGTMGENVRTLEDDVRILTSSSKVRTFSFNKLDITVMLVSTFSKKRRE